MRLCLSTASLISDTATHSVRCSRGCAGQTLSGVWRSQAVAALPPASARTHTDLESSRSSATLRFHTIMRSSHAVALLLLLAGCDHAAGTISCDTSFAQQNATTSAALSRLTALGWTVDPGLFYFPPPAEGHANNPSTRYGRFAFEADQPRSGNATWRLGPRDVIAWLGCTPPASKYWSWRSYLTVRTNPLEELIASLGDSANHLVFNTTGGAKPFNATALLITTADGASASAVEVAFVAAGHPASALNRDVLPASVVRLGYTTAADIFDMSLRFSIPANKADADAYMGAQWPVFRLRAPPGSTSPLPLVADRPRGHTRSEAALAPSLAQLIKGTTAAWAAAGLRLSNSSALVPFNQTGWTCIQQGLNCQGAKGGRAS